jgi:uncharacterized protein
MTSHYLNLLFSDEVMAAQERNGSRKAYARHSIDENGPDHLTDSEIAFITHRDSFYLATAGANGWPYIQHRGGPSGFVKVLDAQTLAIADYRGNRQYVSVGNAAADDRVSLFFMDYARRTRLKVMARMQVVEHGLDATLDAAVIDPAYKAHIERALVFKLEAFDWNCPQHITPRYTMAEIEPGVAQLRSQISELEAKLAQLTESARLTKTI